MHLKKLSYFAVIKNHVKKVLRSAIMKKSRLKNKANKTGIAVVIFNCKKQRNLVVKINNQCKREYFAKLNVKINQTILEDLQTVFLKQTFTLWLQNYIIKENFSFQCVS